MGKVINVAPKVLIKQKQVPFSLSSSCPHDGLAATRILGAHYSGTLFSSFIDNRKNLVVLHCGIRMPIGYI